MFRTLLKPQLLIGAGSVVMLGAAVYEYSIRYSNDTGFHIRDPDPRLRKIEKDVLIPKIMRDLSRTEDCATQVEAFNKCCMKYKPGTLQSYMTFRNCKKENADMMDCMNSKFVDWQFYEKCKGLYLQEKKVFEITKLDKKKRNIMKDVVQSGKPPNFPMKEDVQFYYDSLKSAYETSKDINSYDESLLSK